jgi:ribosome modulation factor
MVEDTSGAAHGAVGDDRLRRAFEDGYAAAAEGEEAAPGCTTTAEGRAFLRGYVEGAKARGVAAARAASDDRG